MAWIESHTVLLRHRKLVDLAKELRLRKSYIMGHLHALWHAALEQQEDGDLSGWTDEFIAESSDYSGDAPQYVRLLQKHSWLDGKVIHDWLDYAGLYLTRKYSTSNPERLRAIWSKHGREYGIANEKRTNSERIVNIPNRTRPNQPTNNGGQPPGFAEFWAIYPRKVGKVMAEAEWVKNAISGPLLAIVLEAVKVQARSRQWQEDGGKYIPHPRTWLHQRRWEDEVPAPKPKGQDEAAMKSIWRQSGLSDCHGKAIDRHEDGSFRCSVCIAEQGWYKPELIESGKEG